MKRIIGRKIYDDQTKHYGAFKVPVVNADLIDINACLFRFRWANDIIDNLRVAGNMCYNLLDVGTFNGVMAAIAAMKPLSPEDGLQQGITTGTTINVDALETHKESFEAASALAKQVRDKGFKMTVHNIPIEEFESDIRYDIVTMFECLEHTKDPLYCVEKIYDLLEIGGHLMITVPEENGKFGIGDKNPFHYWTATAQSLVSTLFYDDRKWHVKQMFEHETLIHCMVQKRTYQA